jgi:hypothetical protein
MLMASSAQRTRCLAQAQAKIGIALGGAAGSRLASQLAMPVNGDTILRLVHRLPEPDLPTPAVIGVDDWAMRKRLRYGTIVVDLERHRPIDLLPGRTAGPVIDRLHQRPGIPIVARDRSTKYRSAITTGAPNADRWHLLLQRAADGRALDRRSPCASSATANAASPEDGKGEPHQNVQAHPSGRNRCSRQPGPVHGST